ncbi:hypothetical protein ACIBQX_49005 [Nonomuraea sp. NPDC049714]|uniref:hypothetical protein n=1 Tax=Nonomuraea sp. NPDC049714 TaxID=3364357 RepID=UPI00378943F2
MSATSTPAAVQGEARVLAMLRQSVNVTKIADATTWPVAAVRRLAAREGLLLDEHGVPHVPGASPTQVALAQADVRELLRLAAACPDPQVKRARAKLEHAVAVLRGCLVEAEKRKERQAFAAQVIAEAERDIARLTAQLDQAKARLGQAKEIIGGERRARLPGPRRYRPGTDYDTKQARAWAKANGHGALLPTSGRWVPDEVIDAMRAAQGAPQTASPAAPENPS